MGNYDSELKPFSEADRVNNFEVIAIPAAGGGTIYDIYFFTEEAAAKAVQDFWSVRSEGRLDKNFQSGMWQATQELTNADRTSPVRLNENDQQKHPSMTFKVQFNGNTKALSAKGESVLVKLGFI